jgi:hypothetical protein
MGDYSATVLWVMPAFSAVNSPSVPKAMRLAAAAMVATEARTFRVVVTKTPCSLRSSVMTVGRVVHLGGRRRSPARAALAHVSELVTERSPLLRSPVRLCTRPDWAHGGVSVTGPSLRSVRLGWRNLFDRLGRSALRSETE